MKSLAICTTQLAGGVLLKTLKYFEVMLLFFLNLPYVKNDRIFIGLCKEAFMNSPIIFLEQENTTKLVSASFSCVLEILRRKEYSLAYKVLSS